MPPTGFIWRVAGTQGVALIPLYCKQIERCATGGRLLGWRFDNWRSTASHLDQIKVERGVGHVFQGYR